MTGSSDRLTQPALLAMTDGENGATTAGSSADAVTEARVVAEGVAKRYGDAAVLHDVDLRLTPRSLVAIAGSNGVGKSTLLACLAGTIHHEGVVTLDGVQVGRGTRGRIAYLPQRLRLPGSSSGAEVLKLFRALGGNGPDRVSVPSGFLPAMDKPVGQLSGGQAQRVALAAVLQGSPDLVLLDEPFANLDDDAREQAHRLLRAHRDAGATVLIASPTALDLLAMIDRVLLLEDGTIGFDGVPSRYAGRMEMTVWVRLDAGGEERLDGLEHILRLRREGDWVAIECHEDRAIGLLRDLEGLGIPSSDVRLGGPAEARVSESPGTPRQRSES